MRTRTRLRRQRRFHVQWTAAQIAPMGRLPDIDVAARAGVTSVTVASERLRRGIARWRGRRDHVAWTEPMLALLGTDTDANVASVLGIHHTSVTHRRRVLRIPSFGPSPARSRSKIVWSRRALALLGKAPDLVVARKLHLSETIVWWKRQLLGVPSFRPARRIQWPRSVLKRLGKAPDQTIARDLGVSTSAVGHKRETLRIPPFPYAGPIVRTPRLKPLLKLPNAELTKRFEISSKTIAKLRREDGVSVRMRPAWTRELMRRLGQESDLSIARRLGVPYWVVAYERRRLGIPPWDSRRRWKKSETRLLGRYPDVDVARRLGVSDRSVRVKRQALGIRPYRKAERLEDNPRLEEVLNRPNRELSRQYGVSVDVIYRLRRQYGVRAPGRPPADRWTEAVVARLGKVSDAQVARELGIHTSSVHSKRQALGIARWSGKRAWTKAERRLLGRLPDRQIAFRLGLSADTVGDMRRELGIPCAPLAQ